MVRAIAVRATAKGCGRHAGDLGELCKCCAA
jgi:hypothetical protein